MNPPSEHRRIIWLLLSVLVLAYVALFGANSLTRFKSYSPDSLNYVDVARNVAEGRGLVQSAIGYNHPRFLGTAQWPEPFISQPPLYPVAIAALGKIGIEPADGALLLPVLAFAGILLLAGRLAFRGGGPAAASLAIAALAWYPPLTASCRIAWSDALGAWAVLAGLSLMPMFRADEEKMSIRRLVLLGVMCGIAFATRYALIVFMPFAGLMLLVSMRGNLRARAMALVGWAAGAAPLPAVILIHNQISAGCLLPPHNPSTLTFGELIQSALSVIMNYTDLLNMRGLYLGMVLLLAVIFILRRSWPKSPADRGVAWLVAWVAVYLAFIIWQRWRIHFDDMTPRLLLPALVPLVIALATWTGSRMPPVLARFAPWFAMSVLALAVGREIQIAQTREPVDIAKRIAYSPRLVIVRDRLDPEDMVIGNDPLDVAFYLQRKNIISFSPHPYSDYPSYPPLMKFLDAHPEKYRRAFIVIRDSSRGDDELLRANFGPFIFDLLRGREANYPRIHRVGLFDTTFVFKIEKNAR